MVRSVLPPPSPGSDARQLVSYPTTLYSFFRLKYGPSLSCCGGPLFLGLAYLRTKGVLGRMSYS